MKRETDVVLSDLLTECADRIRDGSTVSACLALYPEHAAELEPVLMTLVEVRQLKSVPPRAPGVAEQRRAQFMLAAEQMAAARPVRAPSPAGPASPQPAAVPTWWQRLAAWIAGVGLPRTGAMPTGVLAVLLLVLIGGLFATGILDASARALPGDLLYPIKTSVEDLRLTFMRDPAQRDVFQEARSELRRMEARTVVDTGRKVRRIPLQGEIEAIQGDRWIVSGLEVLITSETNIIGTPRVGARVDGVMTAPGDYTLVGAYLELEPPAPGTGAAPTPTSSPSPTLPPTATRVPPTPKLTPVPATPTPAPVQGALPIVRAVHHEPTEWPTTTPTFTPTHTRTPLPTATRTPTPTTAPSATPTEFPEPTRELVKGRIIGWVKRIEGSWWTIDEVTVECDGGTKFYGNPDVGSQVEAIVEIRPNGSYVGLEIHRIGQPDATATPSPVELTEVVNSINDEWWTIGGTTVKVTGETQFENEPGLGDMVSVKAELRGNGEIVALRIRALRAIEVNFQGVIETMDGGGWVISGTRVIVDGSTEVRGTPEIGATVQVAAIQQPDGALIAKVVAVVAPPPPLR